MNDEIISSPCVSIIMPNYNCIDYIAMAIESVLFQTYKNWEMIIVDDCSTDDSYEKALGYAIKDSRIKVYRMEKNCGAAACRNRAMELSLGQYLAFLDSDDLWFPEKLEKQIKFMSDNDCDFSFTEYELIDEEGKSLRFKGRVIEKLTHKKMLTYCFTGCLTVVYRQDVNNKIYSQNVKTMEDYLLFINVLKKCTNARGYPVCLAKHRIRKKSLSSNKMRNIGSYFKIMIEFECMNYFSALVSMIIFIFMKIFWRYTKIKQ
jgi:glycosyltransferase involved in cell wall biosynthesis